MDSVVFLFLVFHLIKKDDQNLTM